MNEKFAKMLRGYAGYRNQSATPGTMPFPGIARFYQHPVVTTRQAIRTAYVRTKLAYEKITYKVLHLAVNRWGKGIVEMEICPPGTVPIAYEADGKTPTAFNTEVIARAKLKAVPVTKPARLAPQEPKGIYRGLKRLARKGLLHDIGAAIIAAHQPKEVSA